MLHVLIVDDDRDTAEMLATACTVFGYSPVKAHSGKDALEIISSNKPDIVLLDLMMPEMDGYETLRRLRSMPEGNDLPVIVITAMQADNLEASVDTAGGDACIRKPIDLQALARTLSEYCSDG
ncbi:MAG: response regulator [Anaerolineales bacterium]|nr:response regulator [Anaerolineales bacterium]